MGMYEQILQYPERAEYIDQHPLYRVRVDHWRELSEIFLDAFKAVHDRHGAAVLLVHGTQGTGKTLFCRQLQSGFDSTRKGQHEPDEQNLWHALVADRPMRAEIIGAATDHTAIRRVEPESGWLAKERSFARDDEHAVRIFVVDDVHRDVFLREWAGLSQGDYLRLKAASQEAAALESVAQQIVQDCRGDFRQSIFLLLSNNDGLMARLKEHLDGSHRGLAMQLELPLPAPVLKEEIVRTNTNRLNHVSYWYCLDRAGPDEKHGVHTVLTGQNGFTDSFQAIGRALGSVTGERRGRPANKNAIALVTLGTDPMTARAFIEDHQLNTIDQSFTGRHLGFWFFRGRWASSLYLGSDAEISRRASMLESEFALLWVTLDIKASYALLEAKGELSEQLVEVIKYLPRVGKKTEAAKHERLAQAIDQKLTSWTAELGPFEQRFRAEGAHRSQAYEAALRQRLGDYGRGFRAYAALKPDLIIGEYKPCAVTSSSSGEGKAIEEAIKRTCHVIEFTSHLQPDMRGMVDYLLGKVTSYAQMLESV